MDYCYLNSRKCSLDMMDYRHVEVVVDALTMTEDYGKAMMTTT